MRPGRRGRAWALSFSSALRERLDVGVAEVAERSALRSRVDGGGGLRSIVARPWSVRTTRIERRSFSRSHASDEAGLFDPVDDAGEAALAVEDPLGELVHAQTVGSLLEVDEDVVPAQRDTGVALELGVEHVDERERALEVEAPGAQPLGEGLDSDCSS